MFTCFCNNKNYCNGEASLEKLEEEPVQLLTCVCEGSHCKSPTCLGELCTFVVNHRTKQSEQGCVNASVPLVERRSSGACMLLFFMIFQVIPLKQMTMGLTIKYWLLVWKIKFLASYDLAYIIFKICNYGKHSILSGMIPPITGAMHHTVAKTADDLLSTESCICGSDYCSWKAKFE